VPIYVELVGSTLGSEDIEIRAEWEVTSFRLTSQKAPSSDRQPRLLGIVGVRVSRRASAGKRPSGRGSRKHGCPQTSGRVEDGILDLDAVPSRKLIFV
jgi:hypothetical protein